MDSDRPLAGAGITLPAACAGAMLPGIDLPCALDAEVACWGPVVAADGSPVVALVTVCKRHTRFAMAYLKRSTPDPSGIEAWRLENFVEHQRMFVAEGIDIHVLSRRAA